jgi:hypothetical protein
MLNNVNSLSAEYTEDIIKNDGNDACFCSFFFIDNLAVALGFLTLRDKHNIRKLSKNIQFICTCCETGQETKSLFYLFLKFVQINYIFSNNARILSLSVRVDILVTCGN